MPIPKGKTMVNKRLWGYLCSDKPVHQHLSVSWLSPQHADHDRSIGTDVVLAATS